MSASTVESDKMHVLIIGAGVTGLLIAQGLQKSGIPYTIFERESPTSGINPLRTWSMVVHWGADYFPICLPDHLLKRTKEMLCDPTYDGTFEGVRTEEGVPMLNGETGEVVTRPKGNNPTRMNRQKIRMLCKEGIDIQYNKTLTSFQTSPDQNSITATFSDGTSATGTHLVGSDSARSVVRSLLFKETSNPDTTKVTEISTRILNFTQKYSAEQALFIRRAFHPINKMAIHPKYKTSFLIAVADVPDPSKPETWLFQLVLSFDYKNAKLKSPTTNSASHSDQEDHEDFESFGYMANLAKDAYAARTAWLSTTFSKIWCEPFRSALANISPTTRIPDEPMSYWEQATSWPNFNGRITLAGDSAHPMTPSRGQGLNNAIRDAAEYMMLMQSIRDGNGVMKEMVDAYDKEVLERGKAEIGLSLKQSLVSTDLVRVVEGPLATMGLFRPEAEVV